MIKTVSFIFLLFHLAQRRAEIDRNDEVLKQVYYDINNRWNFLHPTQYNLSLPNGLQPHHHGRRCANIEVKNSIEDVKKGLWKPLSRDLPILVHSPCLGSDSLGNYLGVYFEAIACAQLAGMHYLAVAKVWEPKSQDAPTFFIDKLPTIVQNEAPLINKTTLQVYSRLKQVCTCEGSCHERVSSAWVTYFAKEKEVKRRNLANLNNLGSKFIGDILTDALNYHMKQYTQGENVSKSHTVVTESDLTSVEVGTTLPLVPDAAIHYRCGDNFVGWYGFLPFEAFVKNIPPSARTIYVLAEKRTRKTSSKRHLAAKCDEIFKSLFAYLQQKFPSSTILIRRGDDLYVDMWRLANANTTICSVSTFCLWPAIINKNKAFFPMTKLVVGGDTRVDLNFEWLTSPRVVLGAQYEFSPTNALIERLGGKMAVTSSVVSSTEGHSTRTAASKPLENKLNSHTSSSIDKRHRRHSHNNVVGQGRGLQ